jgi:O-acetylhomoserine/O-acetylserine sulfhydrylase-like pyridoxal-dependent enzyme
MTSTVQSITKWVGGHGTTLGGMIVDSGRIFSLTEKSDLLTTFEGNFNWERSGKFPEISSGMFPFKSESDDIQCMPWKSAFAAKVRHQVSTVHYIDSVFEIELCRR